MSFEEENPTKKFLLEHVLYEMEMYLYTYKKFQTTIFPDGFLFNTFWNAHNVALRNLMCFFSVSGSSGSDEIRYDYFSFAEKPSGRKKQRIYYSALSKAINHITVYRFEGFNGRMLDEYITEARAVLFPEMSSYILTFLNHLEEKSITYDDHLGHIINVSDELRNPKMRDLVLTVRMLLKDISDIDGSDAKTELLYKIPVIIESMVN